MGLFSFRCRRCGGAIVGPYTRIAPSERWLTACVVLTHDGAVYARGTWDGYGRVSSAISAADSVDATHPAIAWPDASGEDVYAPEIYHAACLDSWGPLAERGPSHHDPTQGGHFGPLPRRRVEPKPGDPKPGARRKPRAVVVAAAHALAAEARTRDPDPPSEPHVVSKPRARR